MLPGRKQPHAMPAGRFVVMKDMKLYCSLTSPVLGQKRSPNLKTEDVLMCCVKRATAHLRGGWLCMSIWQWWNLEQQWKKKKLTEKPAPLSLRPPRISHKAEIAGRPLSCIREVSGSNLRRVILSDGFRQPIYEMW
jgi:hypothetical protein